jgi:hypothetical protein
MDVQIDELLGTTEDHNDQTSCPREEEKENSCFEARTATNVPAIAAASSRAATNVPSITAASSGNSGTIPCNFSHIISITLHECSGFWSSSALEPFLRRCA